MMQHDNRGTFGVAVNKLATKKVAAAWQKLTGAEPIEDQLVVAGGPLQGPVIALHQLPELCDVAMPGGIFVAAQVEKLHELIQHEDPYRIVVGIAGWQQGQLQQELNAGCWYVLPSDATTVFDEPDWIWESCIANLIGYDEFPDDPTLN